MSSTLESLGLPQPEKADTLTRLGLPAPEAAPARRGSVPGVPGLPGPFVNPFSGPRAGDEFSPERIAARDQPIVPEYPLEMAASMFGIPGIGNPAAQAFRGASGALKALPWFARSAGAGAAAGATGGAIAESGRGPLEALQGALTGAAAGAVLSPPLEAGIGAVARALRPRGVPPVPPAGVSPVEPVDVLPVAGKPVGGPPALPGPRSVGVPVEPGPATTANAQQFPQIEELRARIQSDPAYLERLKALGGGRVVSNAETLGKALDAGPMPVDELAAWPADAPIDPVTQTRGLLTFDYFQQRVLSAIREGDLAAAADANATIGTLMPGVTNLRATGGRVTQAQAMFVQDEMAKVLGELADMQAKGVPFEQVQARANELVRAARTAAKLKGFGKELREALGGIETAATFAKLTSPVTHAVNTISNALTFGVVRPLEKAGTAAAFAAQGNLPAARAELSTVFGTRMGFRNGFERYVKALLDDAGDPGKMVEVTGNRNLNLPKALRPFDVFRHLSAADAFWKGVLRDARLNELAYRSAAEEGLAGPALAARIKTLVDAPPAPWAAEADTYAKEFTFQSDPDKFLSAVQKIQNLPGVRLFIPFVQTPYNLAKFQFQRSMGSLLSPRNVKGLAAGGTEQAEAVGRLTAAAGLSAGALALVQSTPTTGDYPEDPNERALWQANGIKPYSIRLPNGTWLAYNRFAPVGMYIGQAVALREAQEKGDEAGVSAAAQQLAAASLKQINDMPFLSGLSDMLDAVKEPERGAERFGTGIVTGMVPNILRDVRQQTDSTMREARGVIPGVQNMIPGLSQKLPASVDVLGRDRTYDPDRRVRATKVLSTRRESPEGAVLERVQWAPSPVSPILQKGDAKTVLKGEDLAQFRRDMGAATTQAVLRVSAREGFARMSRDDQVEAISEAVSKARKPVRKRWTRERVK